MAYTDLIKIERPFGNALDPIAALNAKASAGEVVEIYVYIKNQHSSAIGIKPRAIVNGSIEVVFTVPWIGSALPGYTYYFTGHFTMPNANAEIRAESYYYGVDAQWHFEDYQTRTINLATVVTERLVINRNPVAGGTVTVSPAPTSGTTYDGYYPKNTTVYLTAYPSSGYRFKEWSGGGLSGTDPSTSVYMSENRTVTANFEQIPAGSISSKILEYDSTQANIPVSGVPNNKRGLVHVKGRNDTTSYQTMGMTWTVTDPDSVVVETHQNDWAAGLVGAGQDREFIGGRFDLSKVGTYHIRILMYMNSSNPTVVADSGSLTLCTVVASAPVFSLSKPSASPTSAPPGNVTITCPVTVSNAPTAVSLQVKCIVYEGKIEPWAGTKLWEQTQAVSLANGAHTVQFTHPSVVGTIDRRDVGVEVYYGGVKVKDGQWDDVFYVTQPQPAQTLKIDIDPVGRGHVTTSPASVEGKTTWNNNETGKFPYGTDVKVTAVPTTSYQFEKWADEIVGGVSYKNPEYVQPMTEHRGVKCHFKEVTAPPEPGPNFVLVQDHKYPFASTYAGKAETQPFTFSLLPEQIPFQDWWKDKIINAFEQEVSEQGSQMLELKVWEDTSPTLRTDYRVEATCTASPVPWTLIIVAVLAILFLIAITFAIGKLKEFWYGPEDGGGISGFGDMIFMLVIMMMMMMMMEQTRELYEPPGTPPRPKPVTEAAIKAAKWVGREAVELAEKGWEEAKKLVSQARKDWAEARVEDKERKAEELRRVEEHEADARRKLREAKAELRKQREEQAQKGGW